MLDVYRSVRNRLVEKYGGPSSAKKDVEQCQGDAAACVVAGQASFAYDWQWPTKQSVSLVTKAIDGRACVVISYETPEHAGERQGPAL
jgi:hypothetical protein